MVFSFNEIEGSVQARTVVKGVDVALLSQEGAAKLSIENDASGQYLKCFFDIEGIDTSMQIYLSPCISVKHATLLK